MKHFNFLIFETLCFHSYLEKCYSSLKYKNYRYILSGSLKQVGFEGRFIFSLYFCQCFEAGAIPHMESIRKVHFLNHLEVSLYSPKNVIELILNQTPPFSSLILSGQTMETLNCFTNLGIHTDYKLSFVNDTYEI